jgi:multidrug efflux pump subunit AcrB
MKPIPLNVPIALAVSLFVAYVFTPYLAKKLIKPIDATCCHGDFSKETVVKVSLLRRSAGTLQNILKKIIISGDIWKR